MIARKQWWTVVAEWQDGGAWVGHVLASGVSAAIEAARMKANSDDNSTWSATAVFPGRQTAEWVSS